MALTACSSTCGPIIPPSITLIIYGVIAEVSITQPLLTKAADLAWRIRLVRSDPAWIELIFRAPLIDSSRSHSGLGMFGDVATVQNPRWPGLRPSGAEV